MDDTVHIFGIRHHGPGSARSLRRSLEDLHPDMVLVEGPPDAEALLPLASLHTMKPPVALLVYVPEQPQRAIFYPFAIFSPEWSAMQYAQENWVTLRFMDLPQCHRLAPDSEDAEAAPASTGPARADPLRFLAEAAGYSDSERWWENMVEHRRNDVDVFAAILEAMTVLRLELGEETDILERRREAYMRQTIRKAKRSGAKRIAVVCGAWHAPALSSLDTIAEDDILLADLPKVKVASTWIPWTYGRLTYRSGYGAGIESPGWYGHLWQTLDHAAEAWMVKVAHLLREHDLEVSPAASIEAVRLADALASLRGRPQPGLPELNESVQSVFSFGSNVQLRLIEDKLIVGDELGSVPPETPMVPLQLDVQRSQKSLRLMPSPEVRHLDLDLRKDNDLDKSRFLHRLNILDIYWGKRGKAGNVKGTFHELWEIQWKPEFAVLIIEAALWGNTVLDAAEASGKHQADSCRDLSSLSSLLDRVLLAELPETIHRLMDRLQSESVLTNDIEQMMDSLSPLVNIARYGNVRKTDVTLVHRVIASLAPRIAIRLPAACFALDDEAAEAMYRRIRSVDRAIATLQNPGYTGQWLDAMEKVAVSFGIHGLLSGRCCRILLDNGVWTRDRIAAKMSLVLSPPSAPMSAASWIEGFLSDSGQLLLLDNRLRSLVDDWVASLEDEDFLELLPLVRRTFSTFTVPERKQIGERIKKRNTDSSTERHPDESSADRERGDRALPLLLKLLGISEGLTSNG